ncbi:NAD(P)/FAD-dependent oxidoreductase [Pseudoxanthobacter sp.]|uniref:FAD/NAD(P)-dependent oxidoreductase n=1 Tax=Pseudoxanthobacter sp. TaxID=1925742 RepID=UPI002FE22F08
MATPDFVIVGAGPGGIRAAEVLAAAGERPLLADEGHAGGGQIYRRQPEGFRRDARTLYGTEADKAVAVHRTLEALRPHIDYRPRTLAWALRDGELHLIDEAGRAGVLRPKALIVAAGATDRIFPLPGWTQPGIYTLGAAQIALKAQAMAIGSRIVFMGAGPLLYLVAWQYWKAGAAPVAVLDTSGLRDRLRGLGRMLSRPAVVMNGLRYIRDLRRAGVALYSDITPLAFEGDGTAVAGVRFRDSRGQERRIACDGAAFGYHLRAESQLADLAGVPFAFHPLLRQFLPQADAMGRTAVGGLYLAGDGVQLAGADGAEAMGRLAAFAALEDLGRPVDGKAVAALLRQNARLRRFRDGVAAAFPWPGGRLAGDLPDETIVCRCEEVTAGTLRRAVRDLGAPEVNRAKALCRVGMGRCQGRYCGLAGAEIVAAELGRPVADVGRLRGQAPVRPLPAIVESAP